MTNTHDKTTISISKDTREWLTLLKRKIEAAKKQDLSDDDIVRLTLACLDDHKDEADMACLLRAA
jgi:DNA-binding transcriptional regulator YhcF (GntR family)